MPGFTSYDDLISELTVNGKRDEWWFLKNAPSTAQGAGSWQSLWKGSGNPGAGADPAATPGTVYDSDPTGIVAGSIHFPNRSTDTKHMLGFGGVATNNCSLMLYDRLVGVSGLSVATTGNKTVSSSALSRYTGAAATDVQAWLEVTTATTTTAPIVSMNSYTDAAGNTGLAGPTVTFPAAATVVTTAIQLPQNAANRGIRAVSTINVATAASAGVVNLILLRPLVIIPCLANQYNEVDMVLNFTSLQQVFDEACLGLMLLAGSATTSTIYGCVRCAYG